MFSKRRRTQQQQITIFSVVLFVDFAPSQTLHMNPFWIPTPSRGTTEGFESAEIRALALGDWLRSFLCFYFAVGNG